MQRVSCYYTLNFLTLNSKNYYSSKHELSFITMYFSLDLNFIPKPNQHHSSVHARYATISKHTRRVMPRWITQSKWRGTKLGTIPWPKVSSYLCKRRPLFRLRSAGSSLNHSGWVCPSLNGRRTRNETAMSASSVAVGVVSENRIGDGWKEKKGRFWRYAKILK